MSAHTPGPWTATIMQDYVQRVSPRKTIGPFGLFTIASDEGVVASYSHLRDPRPLTDREMADARLIAAAPELAEALQAFINASEWKKPMQEALVMARAALAKAGV